MSPLLRPTIILAIWSLLFFENNSLAQAGPAKSETSTLKQPGINPAITIDDTVQQRLKNTSMVAEFSNLGLGMSNRIQGTSVLNISSSPLIVINGVPYQNPEVKGFDFTTADERDYASMIGIPREDIKEIALLQDAASAAQFGSRAANGVILITTKHGLKGKPAVNYRYEESIRTQPKGYTMLSGPQYETLMQEAYMNTYGIPLNTVEIPEFSNDPSNPLMYYNYGQNTDWTKEITRTSLTHDHYLSVSGGIKKLDYFLSVGYLTQQGITLGSGQQRFTSSLTLDYHITKSLKLSVALNYNHSLMDVNYQPDGTAPIQEIALIKMPNMGVYEIDALGNFTGTYFNPVSNIQGSGYTNYNPVAMANLSHDQTKSNRMIPTLALSYKPFKEICYNLYISYDGTIGNRNTLDPMELIPNSSINFVTLTKNKTNIVQTQNQFIFKPHLNSNHSLIATASFTTVSTTSQINSNGNDDTGIYSISYHSNLKNYDALLRINYQLCNKYSVDITGREEGNSTFGYAYKYHLYPAATIQWFARKENFLKSLTFMNDLTFKFSYGENCNANWANPVGFMLEKLIQQDVGINGVMFNNRMNVNFNLYKRSIINQIQAEESPIIPLSSIYLNPDALETFNNLNRGWEFSLFTKIVNSKNFSINFSIDINRNRNIINKISPSTLTQIGNPESNGSYLKHLNLNQPIGSFYGYHCLGVYSDDEDAIAKDKNGNRIYDGNGVPVNMKSNTGLIFKGGDARYADLNYDGIINSADLVYLGNANASFTGSAGPSFQYKGWQLGVYFNFRAKNKIINLARMNLENMNTYNNQSTAVIKRWRTPGQVTDIPAAYLDSRYNYLGSDRFLEDGSFLRLKILTLQYQFTSNFIKKLHISNLAFYITCKNILTFTHYSGADPEINGNSNWKEFGFDNNITPKSKEFTFGINAGI